MLVPRYGENPHQPAAVYSTRGGRGVLGGFRQLQGKDLSWNNLLDADAARKLVGALRRAGGRDRQAQQPLRRGARRGRVEAYRRALATDPVSAFGSIVAVNGPVDGALAEAMAELFVEVLVAPGFDAARERALRGEEERCACSSARPTGRREGEVELRALDGGYLAQVPDALADDPAGWTCPTERQPTRRGAPGPRARLGGLPLRQVERDRDRQRRPDGGDRRRADEPGRLLPARRGEGAACRVAGTAAASDAFFPFRDGLDALADAGVTAVVQPGGSKRDDEVIAAADERGVAMLLTGRRHFRH